MNSKPQYLIDTYWLQRKLKPKWLVYAEYLLFAVAILSAVGIVVQYFTEGTSYSRGAAKVVVFLAFGLVVLTQIGIRYTFRRKKIGYVRFTTQSISLIDANKNVRKIAIEDLGEIQIEFDFDQSRAHRLWLSEDRSTSNFILFKFINPDDFRKFRNWMEIMTKSASCKVSFNVGTAE